MRPPDIGEPHTTSPRRTSGTIITITKHGFGTMQIMLVFSSHVPPRRFRWRTNGLLLCDLQNIQREKTRWTMPTNTTLIKTKKTKKQKNKKTKTKKTLFFVTTAKIFYRYKVWTRNQTVAFTQIHILKNIGSSLCIP